MKLNYLTFMIQDIEKSIAFYQELAGLRILKRFNPGKGEIAFLGNTEGETMLELIQFDDVEKVQIKGMVMSFICAGDLSELQIKAKNLGYNPSPLISEGKKPTHFTVLDPDGILVEFSM